MISTAQRCVARACTALAVASSLLGASLAAQGNPPKPPVLPSEIPATLTPTNFGFDYDRRDVMISMRDGVKLRTIILAQGSHARADSADAHAV